MKTVSRSGRHLRVADPSWQRPLDGGYARRRGGRWNAPGSFAVVYLNRTVAVARANVLRRLAGQPYGPEDLRPATAPVLVETSVPRSRCLDVVSDEGCWAVNLPASYPRVRSGELVDHEVCQAIGADAHTAGLDGVACRSAALEPDARGEELAWFEHRTRLRPTRRRPFDEWFWPA